MEYSRLELKITFLCDKCENMKGGVCRTNQKKLYFKRKRHCNLFEPVTRKMELNKIYNYEKHIFFKELLKMCATRDAQFGVIEKKVLYLNYIGDKIKELK